MHLIIPYAASHALNGPEVWGGLQLPHLQARFMKTNAVGIWHETYVIDPTKTENIYANMPKFGYAKVGDLQPAVGKRNTATERLSR